MSWVDSDYVKLELFRPEGKDSRWLIALRTTADYYGWTDHFPLWSPPSWTGPDGRTLMFDPGRRGKRYKAGGRRLRICRSESRQGWPRGMTNAFKVSRSCTLFELAELGHHTSIDWQWMESFNGQRLSRGHWEDLYYRGFEKRRGGLVSA